MPTMIQRALISVSDKTDLIDFASRLRARGIELLSTGGTKKALEDANIEVTDVSDYTGFPEMMDGRVKTLHPKIHGGILGRRDIDADTMIKHDIFDIDLVVVNLYPFEQVTKRNNCTLQDAIENIDVGGPALLRAAAKNHEWTTVVTERQDYDAILWYLEQNDGAIPDDIRFKLAAKAFAHTARYDGMIANYLGQFDGDFNKQNYSQYFNIQFELDRPLRYGENPQQSSALYREKTNNQTILSLAELVQGKPLSFNNIVDTSSALECCYQFEKPTCVIVKHANPCGVACADTLLNAYQKAYACDPTSSFGGIIAFNHTVDHKLIEAILQNQFVEAICAPAFTNEAIQAVAQKPNVRVLATGSNDLSFENMMPDFKRIRGGLLVQDWDKTIVTPDKCEVVTQLAPSNQQWDDMMFAWHVAKFVKSNAIVLANIGQTIGIGAGQMSRVFSVEIAKLKAEHADLDLKGCALASDAFFPFKDNIQLAHELGVGAIIQPGGSMRDNEVIQACNDYGIPMVFTHTRHFRH